MADTPPNDMPALLALWSRLELLRAAGVDTAGLRTRVREQLLAGGFDPLAPAPPEPDATPGAAVAAELQALNADLESRGAAIEKAVAESEATVHDRIGSLPEIEEPLPPDEFPDPPEDVARDLESDDPAVALGALSKLLAAGSAASTAAVQAKMDEFGHLTAQMEQTQEMIDKQMGEPETPAPETPESLTNDLAETEPPSPDEAIEQLKQMAGSIDAEAASAVEKMEAIAKSLIVDPTSVTLPEIPEIPGFPSVPE